MSKATFVPRTAFPASANLPRSYFLGHHRAGLREMQKILSSIDLVIECRDYRIPISSRNALLESSLGGKKRVIVYTKYDIPQKDPKRDDIMRRWHDPTPVFFSHNSNMGHVKTVLEAVKEQAGALDTLTGARMMVVGMPNVGKSSILNALRRVGMNKGKAAFTGAQPGVTRKVGNEVRISGEAKDGNGIYLVDTPGVFIPHVPDAETMLKLALCGCVKDSIIPYEILADYLLYRTNLESPTKYRKWSEPTNSVHDLLERLGRQIGKLMPGGAVDTEAAAIWWIQRWRSGTGSFMLDKVDEDSLQNKIAEEERDIGSMNQARRAAKREAKDRQSVKAKPALAIPT